jgi:RNA-directed DNA polymerase
VTRPLFGVLERMSSFGALRAAALRAARHLRARPATGLFLGELEQNALRLQGALRSGTWRPSPMRHFRIRDPKPRTISVAPFADRVVHHALCAELAPTFERLADPDSYACRVGFGQHRAVRRCQQLCRRWPYVARIDVAHYFETVPHDGLLARIQPWLRDPGALEVLRLLLDAGGDRAGRGLPIGNLTSQHLGNFYLSALDHHLRRAQRVPALVRYMDDTVIFAASAEGAWAAVEAADRFAGQLGLRLKHSETSVQPVTFGVRFLGARIWPRLVRLDRRRATRWRRRLRALLRRAARGGDEADCAARAEALVAWTAVAAARRWRQVALAPVRRLR